MAIKRDEVLLEGELFRGIFQGSLKNQKSFESRESITPGGNTYHYPVYHTFEWWDVTGMIVERKTAEPYQVVFSTCRYDKQYLQSRDRDLPDFVPDFVVESLYAGIVVVNDANVRSLFGGQFSERVDVELIDYSATYDLLLGRTVEKLRDRERGVYKLAPPELVLSELVKLGYAPGPEGQMGFKFS
ncbi:hypothetical protein J4210_04250 [Candidatus Woesearchaeota archaeon]|nr:hypothetical protein [Candidatus Woesearchaeota archaeon]